MQDIFLLGILGALLPPPVPVQDTYSKEYFHDNERPSRRESE
jgi:hypothetical protein